MIADTVFAFTVTHNVALQATFSSLVPINIVFLLVSCIMRATEPRNS